MRICLSGFPSLLAAIYLQAVMECFGDDKVAKRCARRWLIAGDGDLYAEVLEYEFHKEVKRYALGRKELSEWQIELMC